MNPYREIPPPPRQTEEPLPDFRPRWRSDPWLWAAAFVLLLTVAFCALEEGDALAQLALEALVAATPLQLGALLGFALCVVALWQLDKRRERSRSRERFERTNLPATWGKRRR
jgi:hypothetical protein